jgi:hypothetical protein
MYLPDFDEIGEAKMESHLDDIQYNWVDGTAVCPRCSVRKPIESFVPMSAHPYAALSHCGDCEWVQP